MSQKKSKSKQSKASGGSFDELSTEELISTIGGLKKVFGFGQRPADLVGEMATAVNNYEVIDISIVTGGYSCIRRTPYAKGAKLTIREVETNKTGHAPLKFYIDFLPVTDREFREKLVDLLKFPKRLLTHGFGESNKELVTLCSYLGISGNPKSKIEKIEEDLNRQIEKAYATLDSKNFAGDDGKGGIVALIKQKKRFEKYKQAIISAQKAQSKTIEVPLTDSVGRDGGYIQNALPASFYSSKLAQAGLNDYSPVVDYINKQVNMKGLEILKMILSAGSLGDDRLLGKEAQEISLLFSRAVEPRKIASTSMKIVNVYDAPRTKGMVQKVRNEDSRTFEPGVIEAAAELDKVEEEMRESL